MYCFPCLYLPVSESRSKTFPGSGWSWPEPSTVASETLSAREEHPGAWGEKSDLKLRKLAQSSKA